MSTEATSPTPTSGNPLLDALPPNTDYLTYLTIIEYNLTTESLPTLHQVLQDTKLTTNIGWDLVHLLLPLLPASQECLQDIARLGNPREVILKVTECLRLIDFVGLDSDVEDDQDGTPSLDPDSHRHPHTTASVQTQDEHKHETTQAVELTPAPLPVDQFICMLSMLSILHNRIKTQYPSRFLSTSLQAVLHAFSNSVSHREELISAIVRFVKDISGTKRPHLPSRSSSSLLTKTISNERAPDPESEKETEKPTLDESDMQKRLIQSFITFVIEEYMLALRSRQDAPGLSWATRLQERLHPERIIPGKASITKKYESQPALHARLTAIGELLAISQDLGIATQDLLDGAKATEDASTKSGQEETEPPNTAADVPYSKTGSLLLYTARTVGRSLYSKQPTGPHISIFPTHQYLLSSFVSSSNLGGAMTGTEPEALLDALLALALQAIEANDVGQPDDTEKFNSYLQVMSLIASNCPSPSLRYVAFFVTSTILRSNPSDIERLAFIRDTLQHCPFDNLKVAAISWIKGETIEASGSSHQQPGSEASSSTSRPTSAGKDNTSIFATPIAIDSLSPYLFPDLTHDLSAPSIIDSWASFDQNLQFYLGSLNFYFLLLSADHLQQSLNIGELHVNNDIGGSFLGPLGEATARFRKDSRAGGELSKRWTDEGDFAAEVAKLELMEATLERVTTAVAQMNRA
ncbi:DUF1760-domain-containing protein [Myriangium duriaei CBS 260.36]|uniref:DUF1760-domain-containing protein n=1 Tax=Myriangium duriaei CBS 260.36 TaxID=1168546 RepID=A0A9P4J770_9PEZI|nr:DUF1760-domain-containing protein [Myriangium duriaei CBS 260.36]